jgi:hypothetical protein
MGNKNTNDTGVPTPHISLQDAADLLRSYGWPPGQVTAITVQTDLDWIESRERAYKLADYNDAKAARMAAHQRPQPTGTAARMPKVKAKKVAPWAGTASMFGI